MGNGSNVNPAFATSYSHQREGKKQQAETRERKRLRSCSLFFVSEESCLLCVTLQISNSAVVFSFPVPNIKVSTGAECTLSRQGPFY